MTAVRRTIVGLGFVGAAGLAVGLWLSRTTEVRDPSPGSERDAVVTRSAPTSEPAARTPASGSPAPAAPSAPSPGEDLGISDAPQIEDILAARADDSAEALAVLLAGVESADAVVVAEASLALIGRGAVSALPVLLEQDVLGRPWAAPSVIDALGRLGALATPEERADVVDHLVALMRAEKQRGAVESQGNLLQIYEALGHTGDPKAIEPLEHELVDPAVPTAPKVVVVQALVALRATQSRGLLERVQAELSASATGVGFEAELRRDLLAAIQDALVKLS